MAVKKEKKDTSIFRGRSSLDTGTFQHRLKNPKLYGTTQLRESERSELGKKLFKSSGSVINPGEVQKVERELKKGKWGEFKDMSYQEREKAKRLLRGVSGK